MNVKKPINDIIRIRKSCRTYMSTPIGKEKRAEIIQYLEALSTKDFRFVLVDKDGDALTDERIGTYGVIKGASTFVAGIMKKEFGTIERFGYAFEKIVLFLTSLELGTCWLGASFERKKIASRLHIDNSEIVPVLTPTGYPGTGFNLHSSLVKLIARPDKRLSWEKMFYHKNCTTPISRELAGVYAVPLEMVRLGPSAGNLQPWRIVKTNDSFHFFLIRSSFYTNRLPYDIQKIDMGIAMCHFEMSTIELGLKGKWASRDPGIGYTMDNLEYIISWHCNLKS
jgi:hypothetical protein